MRLARALLVVAALGPAACGGGGPKLHNLRCRTPCQSTEDPFRLLLAVDFDDATGTLGAGGEIDLRLDGKTQSAVSLRPLFQAQALDLAATHGTLQLDDDLVLDAVQDGKTVKVSVVATDGAGKDSNEPSLGFTLHLGTP